MTLRTTRNQAVYTAIQELLQEHPDYPVRILCELGGISRSACYKWGSHVHTEKEDFNEMLAKKIEQLHGEHPDMGYRRIRDTPAHDQGIQVNDKRILRICRKKKIQSIIRHRYNRCTRPAVDPAYIAENILNREFTAEHLNEKRVTDVTGFKYGTGTEERAGKVYLSVIPDLCGHRPVSYVLSGHNDNPLVYDTFDAALAANPGAQPIFHSDRGYQYTSKVFRQKIPEAGMTRSMSRVARCTDNGPVEGFRGIMKREMYYGKKYKTKDDLLRAIEEYIDYYTNRRVRRKPDTLTPMEYHERLKSAA